MSVLNHSLSAVPGGDLPVSDSYMSVPDGYLYSVQGVSKELPGQLKRTNDVIHLH